MPRIKRWFPVSHDINADPEVWEMRQTFGEWMLGVWLQMLSIADRNDGEIVGSPEHIARSLAWVWTTDSRRFSAKWRADRIQLVFRWMQDKRWIEARQNGFFVCNHWKYHRTQEHKRVPSEPDRTRPNLTIKNKTPSAVVSEPLVLPDWLDSETWAAYVEYRKTSRHPLTAHGKRLAIKQLKSLMDAGNDPKAVLEQSILSGWRGLFEIKGGSNANGNQRTVEPKGFAGIRAALARKQARANEP